MVNIHLFELFLLAKDFIAIYTLVWCKIFFMFF